MAAPMLGKTSTSSSSAIWTVKLDETPTELSGSSGQLPAWRRSPHEYVVAGSIRTDSPVHRAYLTKIKENAPHNVKIIEKFFSKDEFLEIIADSDVVILPYLDVSQSGSGILHLSLGLGKPIIASKIGEFVELLRGNALLVDPNDKIALRNAILKMKNSVPFQAISRRRLLRKAAHAHECR